MLFCLLFVSAFSLDLNFTATRSHREPIIMVPGIVASRLQYRLEGDSSWKTLWYGLNDLNPLDLKNWFKRMCPESDPATGTFTNIAGLETRPEDFGGIDGIYATIPQLSLLNSYFKSIIDALKKVGYVVGTDLFGAPYDWRLSGMPNIALNGQLQQLKELVEYAYLVNNGTKVHLLGHSMGCLFIHTLLTQYVPEGWTDKYIASFIPTSGPFAGALEAFAQLMGPHAIPGYPVPGELLYSLTKSFASMYWLLPNARNFEKDHVIARVTSTGETITIGNITEALKLAGHYDRASIAEFNFKFMEIFDAPHVPVHLIYSDQMKTLSCLYYNSSKADWWEHGPSNEFGDGDTIVPIESLRAPMKWADEQEEPFTVTVIHGYSHNDILHADKFVETVRDIVSSD